MLIVIQLSEIGSEILGPSNKKIGGPGPKC